MTAIFDSAQDRHKYRFMQGWHHISTAHRYKSANTKGKIMKDLPIVSVLMVGLIFAIIAYFFGLSASFKAPVASKAGHHSQAVGRLTKYI
jgi:hypothetical protein